MAGLSPIRIWEGMTRSKGLHAATFVYNINGGEANSTKKNMLEDVQIDLSHKLSQQLGRTIKQGHSFRVVGCGATLQPIAAGFEQMPDTGWSANLIFQYVPTTYHSAQAWRNMKAHYGKQKSFRKGLTTNTKYDEFEVAFDENLINSRVSKVYVGGINDPTPEAITILSQAGYDDEDGWGDGHISIKHLYNSKNPVQPASQLVEKDLLFDDTINYKPAKFSSKFPDPNFFTTDVGLSSQVFYDHDVGIDEIYSVGGWANSKPTFFPSDNHIDLLCGLIKPQMYLSSPDDENFYHDGMRLYVTIYVEGWTPLSHRPKSRRTYRGKKGGRRYRAKRRSKARR